MGGNHSSPPPPRDSISSSPSSSEAAVIFPSIPAEFENSPDSQLSDSITRYFCPSVDQVEKLRISYHQFRADLLAEKKVDSLLPNSIVFSDFEFVIKRLDSLRLDIPGIPRNGIFPTKSHEQLFSILISHCVLLINGAVSGREGTNSKTIVGAKGIGKSTMMKAFTVFAATLYNVIPIYITFLGFPNLSINRLIMDELARRGIKLPERPDQFQDHDLILMALMQHKLRILLMVDELDEMYRSADPEVGKNNLNALATFGSQTSGCIVSLICGSSAVLPLLVTANASKDEHVRKEFPLLQHGVTNLNGNKYRTVRVPSATPVETDIVRSIFRIRQLPMREGPDYDNLIKLTTFVAGANSRNVDVQLNSFFTLNVADAASSSSRVRSPSMEQNFPDRSEQSGHTLNDFEGKVLNDLTQWMLEENAELFDQLITQNHLNEQMICTLNWEKKFKYVSFYACEQKFRKKYSNPSREFASILYHLSDRNYIVLEGTESGNPQFVWPRSLMMLARAKVSELDAKEMEESFTANLKEKANACCVFIAQNAVGGVLGGAIGVAFGQTN